MAPEHVAHGAVGAAAVQLQELALDPAISPPRVLNRQANDQLLAFGALPWSAARWPSTVQGPLAADQFSVPAQQRLRADQERPPTRAREEAAQGAEQQAVVGLEVRPADLAFEDAELVAKGENLDLERGFSLPVEDEEVE